MKHTVRLSPGKFVNLDTYTKEAPLPTFSMPTQAIKTFFIYLIATAGCSIIIGAALGVDITQPNLQQHTPHQGV